MMIRSAFAPLFLLVVALTVSPARAQDEGQSDLDKAVDAKLDAKSIPDLGKVIELCHSAIDKGLGEENEAFAKELLGSTLLQRADAYARLILRTGRRPNDPRWRQMRRAALEDLQAALAVNAKQPRAQLLIGRLEALPGGDRQKARKALDEAVRLNEDIPKDLVAALMARASLMEDPKERLADYDRAIELDPENADALRIRGQTHLASGNADLALGDLDASLRLQPDNVTVQFVRGQALFALQKYDLALASLNKVIEKAPEATTALVSRARIHTIKSDHKAAIADLDKTLSLSPGDIGALMLRANNYAQIGQTEKALADLDDALQFQPDLAPALRARASLLASSGKAEQAIEDLERARQQKPTDWKTLVQLGLLYLAQKDHSKAIDRFTTAIDADAENVFLLRSRADAYLGGGRQKKAIEDYEKALVLVPKDTGILNNLAWVLATSPDDKLRDADRSIRLATQACEVTDYRQAHILSTLAAAYAESGDFRAAVKWSKQAVEITDENLREALSKELKSYQEGKPWRELLTEGEKLVEEPAEQ